MREAFASDGDFLDTVTVPAGARVLQMRGEYASGVEPGSLDVPLAGESAHGPPR
jgi:hypothetical protein